MAVYFAGFCLLFSGLAGFFAGSLAELGRPYSARLRQRRARRERAALGSVGLALIFGLLTYLF